MIRSVAHQLVGQVVPASIGLVALPCGPERGVFVAVEQVAGPGDQHVALKVSPQEALRGIRVMRRGRTEDRLHVEAGVLDVGSFHAESTRTEASLQHPIAYDSGLFLCAPEGFEIVVKPGARHHALPLASRGLDERRNGTWGQPSTNDRFSQRGEVKKVAAGHLLDDEAGISNSELAKLLEELEELTAVLWRVGPGVEGGAAVCPAAPGPDALNVESTRELHRFVLAA